MVSADSGPPVTTLGPFRYQAFCWDMAGITMVSEGSGPLLNSPRTNQIPSTLLGHGRNRDGIRRLRFTTVSPGTGQIPGTLVEHGGNHDDI